MKYLKIYIAGPISSDPDYKTKFSKAEHFLQGFGHTILNPANLPIGFEYEEYMKICFTYLSVCDSIYLLNGWQKSPGALREVALAKKLNKFILYDMNMYIEKEMLN